MKSIDLGEEGYGPETLSQRPEKEMFYPTARIVVSEDKGEIDMPDEGTVTFKYRLKREVTTKSKEGEEVCEYELELRSLEGYKGESDDRPSKRDTSAEDALDKLAAEKSKENEDDEDGDEGY